MRRRGWFRFSALLFLLILLIIGLIMLLHLLIFDLVCTVRAAITASNGEANRYPLTIRFIR